VEKEENGILPPWILIEILWQDDEKAFLFSQDSGKKYFLPNQVLKLLG
jgi:hypothetical protein